MAPGFDSLDVCTVRCECVSTTNTGCNSMPGRSSRPSDERRCAASQRSTRPHQLRLRAHFAVLTQSAWLAWGNARFVDDGTSPNLPQRHYRRQETTTQRRRFRCHRQPRLMIACASLNRAIISCALLYSEGTTFVEPPHPQVDGHERRAVAAGRAGSATLTRH